MLIMFVCLKGTENILFLNGTVCKDPHTHGARKLDCKNIAHHCIPTSFTAATDDHPRMRIRFLSYASSCIFMLFIWVVTKEKITGLSLYNLVLFVIHFVSVHIHILPLTSYVICSHFWGYCNIALHCGSRMGVFCLAIFL